MGSTTLKKNDDGDLEDAGRSSLSREMPLSAKNASDTSDVVAQLNTMKLGDGKKVSTDTDKETSKDKESDNSKNNKNNKSNKNNKNNKNNKGSGDTKNKTTNGPNVDSSLTTPYAKGAQQPGGGQNNALLKPSAIANNGNLENPNPGNNGANGGNNGNGGTNGRTATMATTVGRPKTTRTTPRRRRKPKRCSNRSRTPTCNKCKHKYSCNSCRWRGTT